MYGSQNLPYGTQTYQTIPVGNAQNIPASYQTISNVKDNAQFLGNGNMSTSADLNSPYDNTNTSSTSNSYAFSSSPLLQDNTSSEYVFAKDEQDENYKLVMTIGFFVAGLFCFCAWLGGCLMLKSNHPTVKLLSKVMIGLFSIGCLIFMLVFVPAVVFVILVNVLFSFGYFNPFA